MILACLVLQVDDELDDDLISFMKLSEAPVQSDAYFYLLGLAVDKSKQNALGWESFGTVLNQIAMPNYEEYITDFWDVDNKIQFNKIQLFNAALNKNEISDIIDTTKSIYADQKNIVPYISEDKKQLCFGSSGHSDPKYNCLTIKV